MFYYFDILVTYVIKLWYAQWQWHGNWHALSRDNLYDLAKHNLNQTVNDASHEAHGSRFVVFGKCNEATLKGMGILITAMTK